MTDFDPVAWTLGVHGTLAGLSLAGYYKCGDRTAAFSKIATELEQLKAVLRARISSKLEEELEPVFTRAPGDSHFLRQGGEGAGLILPTGYIEEAPSPLGSDAYRVAIRNFLVKRGDELLSNHWGLRRAVKRWCDASRCLSWVLLGSLVWELACSASFGVLAKLCDMTPPTWTTGWSFLPTSLFVLGFLSCLAVTLWNHDIIMRHRRQYGDL